MGHFSSPLQLNRQSTTPLYCQVEEYLRRQIERGVFAPGDMLPSVKVLCEEFGGLNHLTVRQAIKTLVDQGVVESVRGRGTFVTRTLSKTGRIALVLPALNDFLTVNIAEGVQTVLGETPFRTIVMDSRSDPEAELENIRQLEDLPLDGAIILPVRYGSLFEEIYRLKIDRFPFVLIDRYFYDIDVYSVVVDNYRGAYDLTAHLIASGRKRIAWVGEVELSSARDRFQGYCDALNEAGLSYRRALIRKEEDAAIATRDLLSAKERPDAIVYIHDYSAMAGMEVIREMGLRIPEDVAVTGFDDLPEAANTTPPLTTARQPMECLGVEAARMLLAALKDPALAPRRKVLPVETIIRKST